MAMLTIQENLQIYLVPVSLDLPISTELLRNGVTAKYNLPKIRACERYQTMLVNLTTCH